MVNELHDAMVSGTGKQIVGDTLEKLIQDTLQHFGAEEALMLQVKYPKYAERKKKPNELAAKAKQIVEQFKTGKLVISITMSSFLSDWLRHHIKEEDMEFIQFMRASVAPAQTGG